MRIDVSKILAQGEGSRKSFAIVDETIELEDLTVSSGLNGQVTLVRTESGLSLQGEVQVELKLECHRCLREYVFPEDLKINGHFSRQRGGDVIDDTWPIIKDLTIDIAPLVRQEAILCIPIKQLCQPECPGFEASTDQPVVNN